MPRHATRSPIGCLVRRLAVYGIPVVGLLVFGCSDPMIPDYNNPQLPAVIPSQDQLQNQVTGLIAADREQAAFFVLVLETMGRNAYRIDVADPRYTSQPLGLFSPGAFLVDRERHEREQARGLKHDGLARGLRECAKALDRRQAHLCVLVETCTEAEYIKLIETRDSLGLPISTGSGAVAPIACKPKVLTYISALLDSAATNLQAAGTTFDFTLTPGFAGFTSPANFLKFNRALAAKVHIYRGFAAFKTAGNPVDAAELNAALTALDASFYSANPADFRVGVYHTFSTASGDLQNGNYNRSEIQKDPSYQLALPGTPPPAQSDIIFLNITGPLTPLPITIDEELVLMRAEALWGLNRDAEALALSNLVRQNSGGLAPRAPFANRLDLLREILKQKRYSLLFEIGDRLVDYRMFGLYAEMGMELQPPVPGPQVIPFPSAEANARGGNLACQ